MPVRIITTASELDLDSKMERARVCRCLFGRPDHTALRKDLDKELEAQNQRSRVNWNFNFDRDEPLEGRYEWSLVEDSDYVPTFYRKGYSVKRTFRKVDIPANSRARRSLDFSASSDISDSPSPVASPRLSPKDYTPDTSSDNMMNSSACSDASSSSDSSFTTSDTNLVQTTIPQYMRIKKRKRDTEDTDTTCSKKRRDV